MQLAATEPALRLLTSILFHLLTNLESQDTQNSKRFHLVSKINLIWLHRNRNCACLPGNVIYYLHCATNGPQFKCHSLLNFQCQKLYFFKQIYKCAKSYNVSAPGSIMPVFVWQTLHCVVSQKPIIHMGVVFYGFLTDFSRDTIWHKVFNLLTQKKVRQRL